MILKHFEEFSRDGSEWKLKRVVALDLGIARYQLFWGRSYFPTPKDIPKRCSINVKNDDKRCFEWSILSALYPIPHRSHPDRTAAYRKHLENLKFERIDFPVKVTDINRFECQNTNISVNVFWWNKGLYPI